MVRARNLDLDLLRAGLSCQRRQLRWEHLLRVRDRLIDAPEVANAVRQEQPEDRGNR